MKKILLLVLTLLISVGAVVAAPKPKHKKIKFNKYARYEGMAVKKTPHGQGTLYPCSRCSVTGSFYKGKISGGEISFTDHKFVISGEFTLVVSDDKQILIIVNKGKIHPKGKKSGHWLRKNTQIKFTNDSYTFDDYYTVYPKVPKWYFESLKQYAGDKKYKRKTDGLMKATYTNEKRTRKVVKKATYFEVKFKNGTTARYEVENKGSVWTRPNGDFVNFTITPDKTYKITGYKVTAGKSVITNNNITHTFANGNKYTGSVKDATIAAYMKITNFNNLISFAGLTWDWDNFEAVANNGVIVYADGKKEKVVDGLTESEIARREAERLEAERKAKEEAERLEAERKAKEEAERLEAERKAKEEAERLEAERKAKEEAERLEAERKAAEEAAAKAAAEAAAKAAEEAAAKAAAEAAAKAAEEAAAKAAAEAAAKAAEEAAAKAAAEAQAAAEAVAPVAAPAEAPAVEAPAAEVAAPAEAPAAEVAPAA